MLLFLLTSLFLDNGWVIEETEIFQPLQRHEVIVAPSGEVYIVNFAESRVQHYDAEGGKLPQIGRKGKGPGEFTYPSQFFLFDEKIYVYDWLESTVSSFALDGSFISRHQTPQPNVILVRVKGGWIYGTWGLIAMGRPAALFWASEDFSENKELLALESSGYSQGNWMWNDGDGAVAYYSRLPTRPILVASPDGRRAYLTDQSVFALTVIDAEQKAITGKIKRDDRPVPFDEEWGREGFDEVRKRRKATNSNIRFVVNTPDYFPVIRSALFDPDGHLVVDRWRGRPDENHYAITLDHAGGELPQKWPYAMLDRLLGVRDGLAYISCFEEETEEASIVRVPLEKAAAYVAAHPLFSRDHGMTINVD